MTEEEYERACQEHLSVPGHAPTSEEAMVAGTFVCSCGFELALHPKERQ